LLQDIAAVFLEKMNLLYIEKKELFETVNLVQLELQPIQNRKMVFTSHILYGKLVELYSDTPIRFVRASTKLKAYTGPEIECHLKGAYAKRKFLSIEYTKWILKNQFCDNQSNEWLPVLESHKKKCDLADTFCYAVNALKN